MLPSKAAAPYTKKVLFPDKQSTSRQMKSSTLTNAAGLSSLITFTVLLLAWISGFASRLFAVIRFESIIHEFDPWYVYIYLFFSIIISIQYTIILLSNNAPLTILDYSLLYFSQYLSTHTLISG